MLRRFAFPLLIVSMLALSVGACDQEDLGDPPPEMLPRVEFVNLADGDVIQSPVNVCMEASNIEIQPSGELQEGTGHFHVLVDLTEEERETYTSPGNPIPQEQERLAHLGDGSECIELTLEPGAHRLTAVVADGGHVTLDPPVDREIQITVE